MTYENCVVENKILDEERAFYGARNVKVKNVSIDGPPTARARSKSAEMSSARIAFLICVIRFARP